MDENEYNDKYNKDYQHNKIINSQLYSSSLYGSENND